jgi:hypothetical protein
LAFCPVFFLAFSTERASTPDATPGQTGALTLAPGNGRPQAVVIVPRAHGARGPTHDHRLH